MDLPTGFKRWRFHWFECPACGHRDWRAFANVSVTRQPPRMVWRFWCERCGAYASIRKSALPGIATLLVFLFVGPVAAIFIYRALAAGLGFESLVLMFGAFWVTYPLLFFAISRWLYRSVPAA